MNSAPRILAVGWCVVGLLVAMLVIPALLIG